MLVGAYKIVSVSSLLLTFTLIHHIHSNSRLTVNTNNKAISVFGPVCLIFIVL